MSFYDDAKFMFLAGGAAGKDGKAYNIKPISPAKDFTFSRGTNLTATRVGKDGYIEKGREQKLYNTVWAGAGEDTEPTGWNKALIDDGTFDTTSTSGQIRFTCDASDRAYLQASAFTDDGPLAISVYVDEVHTACPIKTVIGYGGVSSTLIGYFEDGVEVDRDDNVQAGKRYSYVIKRTDSDNGYPRIGVGIDKATAGDITLSRPQFEIGFAATAYIENTSTSATATAGLLEDEPRFDYTGGGCPSLLIESTRVNICLNSEGVDSLLGGATATLDQDVVSPTGYKGGVVELTNLQGSGGDRKKFEADIASEDRGEAFSASVYVKGTSGETMSYQFKRTAGTSVSAPKERHTFSGEWERLDQTFTTLSDTSKVGFHFTNDSDTADSMYVWGMQIEKGSYATSYIPTYGSSATRTYDDPNELVHGITMGTSCSIFLEATNFKVTETGGAQTSFLKLRAATSPTEDDRLLFLGVANTASTFTLQAQNKESGTADTLSKTGMTMGSPFKALARYDGTSFDLFVNGVLEGSETIVADDHFGRVELKNLTSQVQNGHSISQVILFDSALSDTECEELTTL